MMPLHFYTGAEGGGIASSSAPEGAASEPLSAENPEHRDHWSYRALGI